MADVGGGTVREAAAGGSDLPAAESLGYTRSVSAFRVLLATESRTLGGRFAKAIEDLPGVSVEAIRTVPEAQEKLETALVDLVVVDLEMRGRRGIDLVARIRQGAPSSSVLVITDRDLRDYDREALRLGVDGFIVQPVRPDHVRFMIQKIQETRRLRESYDLLREESTASTVFGGIIGASGEMKRVYHLVSKAAASRVPVSLYGESGTGKELVARAIHNASPRRDAPFVAVNLASIPDTLLESELFGYVKGAFTGAGPERTGFFENAEGGTLFLDEIGDIPLPLQVKLLRALQEKTIHRVGSSKPVRVDFRLITATHRDLMSLVRAGRFREDLFYRIHVFPIYLPSLRARRGDLPLLAEHFLQRFTAELGTGPRGFGPGVLEILSEYPWPGNVRELENVVHRLVAMKSPGSLVEVSDLAGLVGVPTGAQAPGGEAATGPGVRPLSEHLRDYVVWAYERLGRNKARTARLLEIDRATLYRRLREAGLEDGR